MVSIEQMANSAGIYSTDSVDNTRVKVGKRVNAPAAGNIVD